MNKNKLIETVDKAKNLLNNNTYTVTLEGKTYRRIIPSKEFYVHQWNWDSATHAMGLTHVDEKLAYDEIRSLLSGQWENGLVAQITFNPKEKKYFPGPEHWGTERFSRNTVLTSGLTQPPLLGVAVAYVVTHATDKNQAKSFLKEVLPGVRKYHEYLKEYRDPENSGLLTIVHPWESGTDNSPVFDAAMDAILIEDIPESVKETVRKYRTDDKEGEATHRPRLHDYYRYMYLVSLFRDWEWDYRRIVRESPFAMKEMLVSSIWSRANQDMATMLEELDMHEDAVPFREWGEESRRAIQKSWNDTAGIFAATNVSRGKNVSVVEDTIATFLPLYARAVTDAQLVVLLKKLHDPDQYYSVLPVPSTALNNPKFDLARYWRGPTWPITNLFLIDSLSDLGDQPGATRFRDELIQKTMQTISQKGFFEYYDPSQGHEAVEDVEQALGFGTFSWTAAVYLYLYYNYVIPV